MVTEYSYGIIPLYKDKDGRIKILVVQGAGYWGFPKGHIEIGEKPIEAALRELHEEVGIEDALVDERTMFKDHYVFTQQKRIISKYVGYFVAYAADKKIKLDRKELRAYRWVSLQDAKNLLTYDSAKTILDNAVLEVGIKKFIG